MAYQSQCVRQVIVAVGDSFTETAIRDALEKEDWEPDRAQERLFQNQSASEIPKAAMNIPKLLEASRAANAMRNAEKLKTTCDDDDAGSSASTDVPQEVHTESVSKDVQMIRDVFANLRNQ